MVIHNHLSTQAQLVQDKLKEFGFPNQVVEFTQPTRSAQQAADTIGVSLSQIVKSILFRTRQSKKPILIAASGSNRVDEKKLESLVGEPVEIADATYVQEVTGFSIGGVPPIAHTQEIQVLIDDDLAEYNEIWAAAGSPNAVFQLTPGQLEELSLGKWVSIKKER